MRPTGDDAGTVEQEPGSREELDDAQPRERHREHRPRSERGDHTPRELASGAGQQGIPGGGLVLSGVYVPNPHLGLDMVWTRWYVQAEL